MQNKEIASRFRLLGKLLELHGENAFKVRSYGNAAFRLGRIEKPLADMSEEEIGELPGVGAAIKSKIRELLDSGSMAALDNWLDQTPTGLLELLDVKGLGGKKLAVIWKELGVESAGELLYACSENRLALLKGFGAKTQQNIIRALEFQQSNRNRFRYADLAEAADSLAEKLAAYTGDRVIPVGAVRRKCPVISELAYLAIDAPGAQTALLNAQNGITWLDTEGPNWVGNWARPLEGQASGQKEFHIPLLLHWSSAADWGGRLLHSTGSVAHLEALQEHEARRHSGSNASAKPGGSTSDKHDAQTQRDSTTSDLDSAASDLNLDEHNQRENVLSEKDLQEETDAYASRGLPWIPPEIREGRGEIERAMSGTLPQLLETGDIRGVVHAHSHYSDGATSLRSMAEAARDRGFAYLGISDHSRTAVYAGGLSIETVERQHEEIDALNTELAPFVIFKGIESDILSDGALDYPDEILARFDFVIASIHSGLKMDSARATARLITAIENPYTCILGHPTGRLLLSREGYPIDHKRVIDACAANGVVIEINANPWRLDLDWTCIPYALEKGVEIAVNPDAHSIEGIGDIRWGVAAARKGGLSKSMCWNARDADALSAWLDARKSDRKPAQPR